MFILTFIDHNGIVEIFEDSDLEEMLYDFLVEQEEDFIEGYDDDWEPWVNEVMACRCAIRVPHLGYLPIKLTITEVPDAVA